MCTSPSFVWVKRGPKWVQTPAPCDRCWSCRENYVSDWVGRCLAEAATSEVSCTVSLTYAPPEHHLDISHRVVDPHHFQLFIKRLRNAGHKIRYLVAGEYGDRKGRSHFHAILFFTVLKETGQRPPRLEDRAAFRKDPSIAAPFSRQIPQEEMVHISEWPHGHIVTDWSMTEKSVRYCCEYLYEDGKRTAWFSQSKKPQLGFQWFAEKAMRNRDLNVFPSSFEYLPPGGKPGKKYLMTGATRRDYLNMITQLSGDRDRMSPWVRKTFDKLERLRFAESCAYPPLPPEPPAGPEWTEAGRLLQSERHAKLVEHDRETARLDHMLARGFTDEEDYQAYVANGGLFAEYLARHEVNLSHGASPPPVAQRPGGPGIRPPTGFDRQGKPYWGDPDRDHLAGVFRPRPEPVDGSDGTSEDE